MIRHVSLSPWWAEGEILSGRMDVEEVFEATARMGVTAVDIQEAFLDLSPHPDPRTVHKLRSALARTGLAALSCWFYSDVLGAVAATSIDATACHLERYLAITAQFGARYLVIQNGEPPAEVTHQRARSNLLAIYDRIAPFAEECGVVVGMEAARAASAFNSPLGALDVVDQFDSPWVTLVPDFEAWRLPSESLPNVYVENPQMKQPDPLDASDFERCLVRAPLVHAKFLQVGPDGSDANYPGHELLALVRDDPGEHDISVEYEGWLPEILPQQDPLRAAQAAVAFVRSFA